MRGGFLMRERPARTGCQYSVTWRIMDEYEEAARNLGQGIRNLRHLIDAERERQDVANEAGQPGEDADERRETYR